MATATPYMPGGVEFVGEVRARQRGELDFAASGVVKQVLVEPGDKVRRGQLLAAIETVVPQAQLDAAGAEVERLQVSLNEALRKQERLHAARESGSASEAEWSAAQTEMQMAAAALAAARAQREGSAWARAQAELRAPFDGYVASRQLEVGQSVGSGLPVLSIDGAGREVWVTLPASTTLTVGQRMQLGTPQGWVDSRVLQMTSRGEAGGVRRALLEGPEDLRAGETLTVRLQIASKRETGVQIPLRAILGANADGRPAVFRLLADGKTIEHVPVTLGATSGTLIEVVSGLARGDRVVVGGGHALADGVMVKPVTELR